MSGSAEVFSRLMKSPSQDFVVELFQTAFTCGKNPVPLAVQGKCAEMMELPVPDVGELLGQISELIQSVLFESISTKEGLLGLIPDGTPEKLKKLVVTVVSQNLQAWREQSAGNELSLPALKDFDWRIDIKTASDKVSRMSAPTALIQMKVEEVPTRADELAPQRVIDFEVSKDTLGVMLDGMGKILEQLNSVTQG
mmetsp:Transcript_3114/g.7487  ORF Transcript_3114/g.7487 Transcript_3114/m.7487 type:complete len:196 (+) Transcript_3114:294-881(+)